MDALLGFAAALLALRLAGGLVGRRRETGRAEFGVWAASLVAYALAAAALAWGAAHGWDARTFRAYYLFGGLLTAPLLEARDVDVAVARPSAHARATTRTSTDFRRKKSLHRLLAHQVRAGEWPQLPRPGG